MKKKGFTLIELISVLVILAILALIVTPLVLNIIRNSKESARKRSIDNYGKAIELAITSYMLDNGNFPTEVSQLNVEYSGYKVECGVELINKDTTVYLDKCKVNNKLVDNYKYGIDKRTAVEVLLSKTNSIEITNYSDGNKGEMYTFNHEATEQTPTLTDYRYIGNIPNNYVSFNNGEVWQIIGIFDTDDGTGKYDNRIKLIKNDSFSRGWSSNGANEWVGSTMQEYLNNIYLTSNYLKKMVDDVRYYLGGLPSYPNGENIYKIERGTTVSSGRSTSWTGNVALMYPSDYIFTYALGVDDTCYNTPGICNNSTPSNGWLYRIEYQWTVSHNSTSLIYSVCIRNGGQVNRNSVGSSYWARPVLYLKPEVKIKQGDGTIDNPYIFEL